MHPIQKGETQVLEMKIDLVPGAIPYKSRVRLLNPDQKDTTQIDEWLEPQVIKPSVSPWASPLVPVKKKDRQIRWVTDLRELNKQMIKNSYSLTNIHEILHSLQGATEFLSLDEYGAYHAVRIKPGSYACTAFLQPLWHIPVYTHAVWISQRWECVQQNAGRSHEGGGQRFLDAILG